MLWYLSESLSLSPSSLWMARGKSDVQNIEGNRLECIKQSDEIPMQYAPKFTSCISSIHGHHCPRNYYTTLLLLILFYGCGSSNVPWFNEYSSQTNFIQRIRHNRSGHMFIQLKCTSRRRSWTGLCCVSNAGNMLEDNNAIIQQIKFLCYVWVVWFARRSLLVCRIWGNSRVVAVHGRCALMHWIEEFRLQSRLSGEFAVIVAPTASGSLNE